MKFIQGQGRTQNHLFPTSLEASIDPDNEVRIIDLFADSLNLEDLGSKFIFQRMVGLHIVYSGEFSPEFAAKGRKDRYTLLSEKVLVVLRSYYKEEKPKEYLFEGQFGGKYSASSFRNVLAKSVKKAGYIKKGPLMFCDIHLRRICSKQELT